MNRCSLGFSNKLAGATGHADNCDGDCMSEHTPGPWRTGDMYQTVFGPPNGEPSPETIAHSML